jgi:hypothetical protein
VHGIQLLVEVESGDPEDVAELTSRLREELREFDVDSVTRPPAAAPHGAKGDGLAWAQLAVTFSGSMPALIGAVVAWRDRQRGARVTIEQDGDRLVLGNAAPEEQAALVKTWLERHEAV